MDLARQESQDDISRYWREEREDGAIYHAYLKKVTYHSVSEFECEQGKEFSHLMWETQKVRVIKAGTLEKLVESTANFKGELDSAFVNVFLATYRTFATTEEVVDQLIKRFKYLKSDTKEKSDINEVQQRTIKSVISVWLDTYPEDFRQHPNYPCLHTLERFAQQYIPKSDLALRSRRKIDEFKKEFADSIHPDIQFRYAVCEVNTVMHHYFEPLNFSDISEQKFAEQLTYKDAELFKKVIPNHCLGAVWSRRNKKSEEAPSVSATVEQFNKVSLRVISTILKTTDIKTSQRAKIILKWINIAENLRHLKNFSSLKAIISGLQSHPVYRLRKTWAAVPKESVALFTELSEIFSQENNQLASRALLMKEATAKLPDMDSSNKTLRRKNMQKRQSWIENGVVQGTVPYLGTFLTDLSMIDTANPDMVDGNLINFEKHRKEFEVLAQLKLLQSAAQIYGFKEDDKFWLWFVGVRVFDENESYKMSCAIEHMSSSSTKLRKKSASLGHKPAKFDSSKFALFTCGLDDRVSMDSNPDSPCSNSSGRKLSHSSSASSLVSLDSDTPLSPFRTSDACVIKVSLHSDKTLPAHVYKSIMLKNTDHTSTVIRKVLDKYSIDRKHDEFCLSQILPDGELLIPESANVFYAMNNSVDLNFILRTEQEQERVLHKSKGKHKAKKLSL